jgi:DMSO reductase anchor subunit
MASLGALTVAIVYASVNLIQGKPVAELLGWLALPVVFGLVLEGIGLWCHARDLTRRGDEGAASHYEQTTTFGKTYLARNIALLLAIAAAAALAVARPEGVAALGLWAGAALLILATSTVGRMLFYALVIPTTMPGAFFWRNKAFQEHAQKVGLAARPQTGVALDAH